MILIKVLENIVIDYLDDDDDDESYINYMIVRQNYYGTAEKDYLKDYQEWKNKVFSS